MIGLTAPTKSAEACNSNLPSAPIVIDPASATGFPSESVPLTVTEEPSTGIVVPPCSALATVRSSPSGSLSLSSTLPVNVVFFFVVTLSSTAIGSLFSSGLYTGIRSEEHTPELQSRGHLVCPLLLDKQTCV